MVAMCCFNFGFQYGVLNMTDTSKGISRTQHRSGKIPEDPLEKGKDIVEVWDNEDNWEEMGVKLRRKDVRIPPEDSEQSRQKSKADAHSKKAKINKDAGVAKKELSKNNDDSVDNSKPKISLPRSFYDIWGISPTCEKMSRPRSNVIMYNSLTMCASHILLNMAKYANNKLFVEDLKDPLHKSSHPEKDLIKFVDGKPTPSLFHSNARYCTLTSTDDRNISYISMVRNPLDRLIAMYYSGTQGFKAAGAKVKSFEECVAENDNICVGAWTSHTLVRHFCGYDERCAEASSWAFEQARSNIADKYLVVGVVSDYERFMLLLETLAPTIFSGYSDLEADMSKILDKRVFGSLKEELSTKVLQRMETHLEMDFKLFNFIRHRFLKQVEICDINIPQWIKQ